MICDRKLNVRIGSVCYCLVLPFSISTYSYSHTTWWNPTVNKLFRSYTCGYLFNYLKIIPIIILTVSATGNIIHNCGAYWIIIIASNFITSIGSQSFYYYLCTNSISWKDMGIFYLSFQTISQYTPPTVSEALRTFLNPTFPVSPVIRTTQFPLLSIPQIW